MNYKFKCFSFVVPFSYDLRFGKVLSMLPVSYIKRSISHQHGNSVLHFHVYLEFTRLFTEHDFFTLLKMLGMEEIKFYSLFSTATNRDRFDYFLCDHCK